MTQPARALPIAQLPTPGLLEDTVEAVLADLTEAGYSTPAQLEAARRLEGLADPERLVSTALEAYLHQFPTQPTLADHDELSRFVGWLVLLAAAGPVRAVIAEFPRRPPGTGRLVEHLRGLVGMSHELPASSAARRWLGAIAPRTILGFPGNWPVVATYATAPDGYGSQTLFVVRKRPGGLALIGVIVSAVRGIADAIAQRRLPARQLPGILEQLREAHGALFAVPVGHVVGRIRQGVTLAADQEMPLPLEYLLQKDLLAGLWDVADPAIPLSSWYDPALASQTASLLDHPALASWFLTEADGLAVRDFLREAASSIHQARHGADLEGIIEGAIDAHGEAALSSGSFPPGMRERDLPAQLGRRLEQLAFLFDCDRAVRERNLAATAALELRSGIPLIEQTFIRGLLRVTFAESEFGWLVER